MDHGLKPGQWLGCGGPAKVVRCFGETYERAMVLTYTNKYRKSTGAGGRGESSEREFQVDGVAGSWTTSSESLVTPHGI